MNNFREHWPKRTYTKSHTNYRQYKLPLAKDFLNRCGYTDCSDCWFGGRNNFHIDHFIPWKKHPDNPRLKTDYSNLVYSCSYINILKSNDEGGYLDPCAEDYNQHFFRDHVGRIIPNQDSDKAIHMHKNLKMYLRRYQVIWLLEKLEIKMDESQELVDENTIKEDKKPKVYVAISELNKAYFSYRQYLQLT